MSKGLFLRLAILLCLLGFPLFARSANLAPVPPEN